MKANIYLGRHSLLAQVPVVSIRSFLSPNADFYPSA